MFEKKLKKYEVLSPILDKGKHYPVGKTVDNSMIDAKVIKRLENIKPPCLKEVTGFPLLPKNADAFTIDKLIISITEGAKIARREALKDVQAFKREAKNGSAATLERSSKKECEEKMEYVKELEKLLAEKRDPGKAEREADAKKKVDNEAAAKKKVDNEAAAKKKVDDEAAEEKDAGKNKK